MEDPTDGDAESEHVDHPGKGIGRHVRELKGLSPAEKKEAIKQLQKEHGIANGRFRDKSTDGDDDGDTDGDTDSESDTDSDSDDADGDDLDDSDEDVDD